MDSRKRLSDRYVYLCDGVILICKMSTPGGGGSDLKLRDKHLIRRVDVLDREDLDDLKFTFELVPRDQVCRIVTVLGLAFFISIFAEGLGIYRADFFKKMCQPQPLFVYFRSFQT